jgi:hexosaminidase
MKYDSLSPYGLNWAGYTSVKDAYEWDPKYFSESLDEINILGIEAPIWTETVSNFDELSYLVFPRILGHAEIGWTNSKLRGWDKYKLRMKKHKIHLKSLGINLKD